MNIEGEIIGYLSGRLPGVAVRGDVPNPRPDRLVTVERTGGSADSIVLDRPQISIMCWAPSRPAASELALEVDDALRGWDDPRVPSFERSGLFNFPDSDGSPRYQLTFEGVAYI